MALDKASLIVIKANQLTNATTVASLGILQSIAGVTQIPKIPVSKIRSMVNKAVAIKFMVMAMFRVMGRTMVRPMPKMPMSSRGIQLIPFRGVN